MNDQKSMSDQVTISDLISSLAEQTPEDYRTKPRRGMFVGDGHGADFFERCARARLLTCAWEGNEIVDRDD